MIHIFTTGGTIDKVYSDALSEFSIGDSVIETILKQARAGIPFTVSQLLRKDSLEITDVDRILIHDAVAASTATQILITHGTDTMCDTAQALMQIPNKTIVLCGAMQPARMLESDAAFNIGAAFMAAQTLSAGVYIIMNGQVFDAGKVKKNRAAQRFENT